jgi:glycosyltransferase involved in cell wall biosynthesis
MLIKTNILEKLFYMTYFFIRGKPLQVGYFFSYKMKREIEEIHKNYDCIIFHLIRGSEFLPNSFKGTKILEMTDVISRNYFQLYKKLSYYNPLKYIYFVEKYLMENYEKKIIKYFNYSVLVSNQDLKFFTIKNKSKNKIKVITNGTNPKKRMYKFNKKNNDIIFIGNINYLPNKIACYSFIKNIMPELKNKGININFKIIGQASKLLRFSLNKFENVKVYSNVKKPENLCNNAICGISNLEVVTGVQNKILEYMQIGLPAVVSKKCFDNLKFKKNHELLVYKNRNEFIKNIIKLKINKKFANKISRNSYQKIRTSFTWKDTLKEYNKLI